MSYCRFSDDCDVYIYDDVAGGITIMTNNFDAISCKTRSEAISKLIELKAVGLAVPEWVVEEIQDDLAFRGEADGIDLAITS